MSKRHNYEQLEIYKNGLDIAVTVLGFIDEIRPYRLAEDIMAAAISIPSNISEGSERGTNKEFNRFLEFSSGSSSELATQLTVIVSANKYQHLNLNELITKVKNNNNMIRGFMKTLAV
jgi:four helix bundle protein